MSFAQLVLLMWIPVVIYLFVLLTPRRAVLASFIVGWLFLPVPMRSVPESAFFHFQGLPNLDKATVTSLAVLLCVAIFDYKRLANFRYHWLDVPVTLLCLVPLASSLANAEPTNQLGLYDGISESFGKFITWGLPYLIGRMYFTDVAGMRDLAIGVFLGGFIYIPVVWWEMRMSPSLHNEIFGYHPATFRMQRRYGGYRAMGFMPGGLSVGMWMTVCALTGFWIWSTGMVKRIWSIPTGLLLVPLYFTALVSKATLAMMLLVAGTGILLGIKHFRTALPLVAVMLIVIGYLFVRSTNPDAGRGVVEIVESTIDVQRAESLDFRFHNENMLAARALERPIFGWGGWNRSRVFNEHGEDISTTDGLWIITLGQNGIVGLSALTLTLLLPALYMMRSIPVRRWSEPLLAMPAAIAVILVLHMADNLLNDFPNPVFMLMAGGVIGMLRLGPNVYLASPQSDGAVPQAVPPRRRRPAGQLTSPPAPEEPSDPIPNSRAG